MKEVQQCPANESVIKGIPSLPLWHADNHCDTLKLHLGCGGERWKDFINVDLFAYNETIADSSRSGCVADVVADMRHLGLPPESIDEIFTSHTLEHFPKWVAIEMLAEWYRMLKKNARLVIETPDFNRCVIWLLHWKKEKRKLAKNMFYGNQWDKIDFETHRYVWSKNELRQVLVGIGYRDIIIHNRTATHKRGRDMRIETKK
jgi:predicted SAM-dependent methyltransferase